MGGLHRFFAGVEGFIHEGLFFEDDAEIVEDFEEIRVQLDGAAIGGDGAVEIHLREEDVADGAVCGGVVWAGGDDEAVDGERFFVAEQAIKRGGEVDLGVDKIRVERDGFLVGDDGEVEIVFGGEGVADVVVALGEIGAEFDSGGELCECFVELVVAVEGCTERVEEIGIAGAEGGGGAISGDGIGPILLFCEGVAEVCLGIREIGADFEGEAVVFDCLSGLIQGFEDYAEVDAVFGSERVGEDGAFEILACGEIVAAREASRASW